MASLLIVDDHPLFCNGFVAMAATARPSWQLRTARNGAQTLALIDQAPPALVIIDIGLPDMDGFTLMKSVACRSGIPCVIMSGRDDHPVRIRARAAGAEGFLSKASPPEQLVETIDLILDGRCGWNEAERDLALPMLTTRQAEVLTLLADGHGNKEIRYRLGIAERTVRAHLTELFQLLGAHSRAQAVIYARAMGLIA